MECDALKDWKLNIFKIPHKPNIIYLKLGILEFHRQYVLVPADKVANDGVVV